MRRFLLIVLLLIAPLASAPAQVDVDPFQTFGQTFDDLVTAVHALRAKTNPAALFWLEVPQYPASPTFEPDGAGEAFFVIPIARTFSKPPLPKELEEELSRLRRSARFAPTYDIQNRRLAYYPAEAVAELRQTLAPWLLSTDELAKLRMAGEFEFVAARIPRNRETEFLDALLSGFLHTNRKGFKCSISKN